MFIKLYNENINLKHLQNVADVLNQGGVIIYPTDTVYGLGCCINKQKAVEKVARIKGVKLEKANFSFICHDFSHLSDFTKPIDNHTFRVIKKNLPGPFTFILPANNNVPKVFRSKKKTVGIRIPNNTIILELVKLLDAPLLTTSIHDPDDVIEYTTDPELIYEKYRNQVDLVIDGGYGKNIPSTVIDCTQGELTILRQGEFEIQG